MCYYSLIIKHDGHNCKSCKYCRVEHLCLGNARWERDLRDRGWRASDELPEQNYVHSKSRWYWTSRSSSYHRRTTLGSFVILYICTITSEYVSPLPLDRSFFLHNSSWVIYEVMVYTWTGDYPHVRYSIQEFIGRTIMTIRHSRAMDCNFKYET